MLVVTQQPAGGSCLCSHMTDICRNPLQVLTQPRPRRAGSPQQAADPDCAQELQAHPHCPAINALQCYAQSGRSLLLVGPFIAMLMWH